MDSSHTPRARIPNPNHQVSAATHASLGPSTRQPPLQQPHFHRDPFRPPPQQPDRRGSAAPASHGMYWSSSGPPSSYSPARRLDHRDTLQPAPPPPPSPFSRSSRFLNDHASQLSQSRDVVSDPATSTYVAHQLVGNREMPPPASSPTRASPAITHGRNQQLAAPQSYVPLDDVLPRSSGRGAKNMSISSVLGTDAPSSTQAPRWSPQSRGAEQSPGFLPPTSPDRAPAAASRQDHIGARQPSPRYAPIFTTPQRKTSTYHTSRNSLDAFKYDTSTTDHLAHKLPLDAPLPSRPSSQPASDLPGAIKRVGGNYRDPEFNNDEYHASSARHPKGPISPRSSEGNVRSRERASSDLSPQVTTTGTERKNASAFTPPKYAQSPGQHADQWRSYSNLDIGDADRPIASREGPQLPPEMLHGRQSLHSSAHDESYQTNGRVNGLVQSTSISDGPQSYLNMPRLPMGDDVLSKVPYIDPNVRRAFDTSQPPHRANLTSPHDGYRRLERTSPLPQAVQGASSQPVGPGRDPSIKSEFTRVFSGLGSGVGSTPVPSAQTGSPTPARQPTGGVSIIDEQALDRRQYVESGFDYLSRSQPGRKAKRGWDADTKTGSDNEARKRKAVAHHHHHHHHHHGPNGSRMHHHHLKADEGSVGPDRRQSSDTPFTALKNPTGSTIAGGNRHHHHNVHHHHHSVQNGTATVPVFRRPCVTIKTQPLLQSVSHYPRNHLGSHAYNATVQSVPSRSTSCRGQVPFASTYQVLKGIKDKENCTYTVRVPQFFLSSKSRQLICARRQIWGTDVYANDSDPIAAAIHSGWIQGAWAADVDVDLLDLHVGSPAARMADVNALQRSSSVKVEALTEPPPAGPVMPPQGYDAHLTLLLLPPLEKYTASTWHGIRSRAWSDSHDGMSYKIHRIDWVDAKSMGPLFDKTSEARNERLRQRRRSAKKIAGLLKATHK